MSDAPCRNPNCKSFGEPHPNCKCAVEMAEGGEVAPDFIPDDAPTPVKTEESPDFIPDEAPSEAPDFIPDDQGNDDNLNLSPAELQDKILKKYHPEGLTGYESPVQQAATVAEGLAQGVAGPLAPLAETKLLGIPKEDIAGRQNANPWEHGLAETAGVAGSLATGIGEAGMISNLAKGTAEYARLGKVGSAVLDGMVTNGLIQGGDEASKAILGTGNPEDAVNPVVAIGAASLFGGLLGGAGAKAPGAAAAKLQSLSDLKAASYVENFLAGVGHASQDGSAIENGAKGFKTGYNFYKNVPDRLARISGGKIGKAVGAYFGDAGGALQGETLGLIFGNDILKPIIAPVTNRIGKYTVPATVRWLSQGASGSLFKMIDYADKVQKGTSLINNSIDALFKAGSQQAVNAYSGNHVEKLKNFIDGGGMDQSIKDEMLGTGESPAGFAEGGDVSHRTNDKTVHQDDHLAQNLPEQNMMLQTVKGRVSNYLSSKRPQKDMPKLAFDDHHDDREQKKSYDKALKIAVHPLGVLGHIQDGTIEPEHIMHLNSMYPELTGHLQKKLTERIVKSQMDEEKPSYKIRQGLSMLMGAPLSGEMTPTNIQAAQSVFSAAKQQASSQAPQKNKTGTSSLSKSDKAYLTDDQAREERRQRP